MAATTRPAPRRRVAAEGMLAAIAYDEAVMPALRLARSSRTARTIARLLFVMLVGTVLLMAFAPWQQSVKGAGDVLAFAPDQRPQTIEAPIKGRIVRWGEGIVENAQVVAGQVIAEIRDLDEEYAPRLAQQLLNSEQVVAGTRLQVAANERALVDAKTIVESYESQVRAYQTFKEETSASQDYFVEVAEQKVRAEEQLLAEYEAALPQLTAEVERTTTLEQEGNIATQKLQEVERKLSEARAKVSRAEFYVASARAELEGKRRERVAKIEKAQADIDYAQALLRKALTDVSKLEADVAKAQQELSKAEQYLVEMQVKVARQETQRITAPFDGFLVHIGPNLGTAVLKEGDAICDIVPKTSDRSVQLWLDGNDAPLVEPGRHVRLQFEGWPALQFAGWPSVAVGTFGGQVVSVDATDNGKGKFRVLVRPDPHSPAWPEERFLRQGVRANGWVLLKRVPLWFEVWRQLNGFPPVVDLDTGKQDKAKPPKLPKT